MLSNSVKNLNSEMRLSLETGAVLDDALTEVSSQRLWCKSVMGVLEKCDGKESRQLSAVSYQVVQFAVGVLVVFSREA